MSNENETGQTNDRERNEIFQDKPSGVSIPELAAEYQVSESTLYSLANQGRLPGARRLGKRIVIHRQTWEEWLKTGMGDDLADD